MNTTKRTTFIGRKVKVSQVVGINFLYHKKIKTLIHHKKKTQKTCAPIHNGTKLFYKASHVVL